MPAATPLPRKHKASLQESEDSLMYIAHRSMLALEELSASPKSLPKVELTLREIQAEAYRLALTLSRLSVAGGCDECPSAPPMTTLQAHVLVLADELERQADLIRQQAEKAA
jgi:hypothetical protein